MLIKEGSEFNDGQPGSTVTTDILGVEQVGWMHWQNRKYENRQKIKNLIDSIESSAERHSNDIQMSIFLL